jgi:hypothetical protein
MGFAFNADSVCVAAYSTVLGCSPLDNPDGVVPSHPAIANLPCVRRTSDGALFIALNSSTGPVAWQTLPESAWSHLSPNEYTECSAEEAAIVAAAPVCPIIPL